MKLLIVEIFWWIG